VTFVCQLEEAFSFFVRASAASGPRGALALSDGRPAREPGFFPVGPLVSVTMTTQANAQRNQAVATDALRRYATKPKPARPINISVQLGGSGASETGDAEMLPMDVRPALIRSTKA
jgi:hypothetical protein